jgi:hypothetical protein
LTSPPEIGPTIYIVRPYTVNMWGWSGQHYIPQGFVPSAGPFGRAPQFSMPGSALGTGNSATPHMAPPSFNSGFAEAGAGYISNW